MINDNLKLRGDVAIVLKDKNGNVKESRDINNLVVTAGLTFICARMAAASADVMSHMALGSSTTAAAAGQTDLASANTIAYVSSFEAGEGTGAVTEAGIFNAATSGTMLCRVVFPVVNKQADDTMSVTWTITLTAS